METYVLLQNQTKIIMLGNRFNQLVAIINIINHKNTNSKVLGMLGTAEKNLKC